MARGRALDALIVAPTGNFFPNCRHHKIRIADTKELPQNSDALYVNYQHVDCLYTLFKYCFSGKLVVKSGQVFDYV